MSASAPPKNLSTLTSGNVPNNFKFKFGTGNVTGSDEEKKLRALFTKFGSGNKITGSFTNKKGTQTATESLEDIIKYLYFFSKKVTSNKGLSQLSNFEKTLALLKKIKRVTLVAKNNENEIK
jgi:hypothetical protein